MKLENEMTLDEAIAHAEERADGTPCGENHRQLAEWLKELKKLREVKDHLANGLIAIKAVASGHEHALDELGTVYRTARAFLSQVGIDA